MLINVAAPPGEAATASPPATPNPPHLDALLLEVGATHNLIAAAELANGDDGARSALNRAILAELVSP